MDAKRKFSKEKELCWNDDGKRKKVVTPEIQGADGNGTCSYSKTELDVRIDVPVVVSNLEENVFGRDHSSGSSLKHVAIIGNTEATDLNLHENKFEIQVTSEEEEMSLAEKNKKSEEEMMKDKEKDKSIFDLNGATLPKEETVSNPFETHGEVLKICEHYWMWKEGLGHICWKCDIIGKKQELPPGYESSSWKLKIPEDGFSGTGIFPHPAQQSSMKPHHVEAINFLCRNLAIEDPNGCILAQAPLSEKTFLMITFIRGFFAKYPNAKPLFVLPSSMFNFWKKEFRRLEVNDIMLLDFHTEKAYTRPKQLEVLMKWVANRSILFLGLKQFSNMVSDNKNDKQASIKQFSDILLDEPSLVIFDRGTDPRKEMVKLLKNLARIKTSRKFVFSWTVYQNHVKEVFNILDIVFPEFLEHIKQGSTTGKILNVDGASSSMPMFDKLEEAILSQDAPHGFKSGCLTELRMLTSKIIYNHKGEQLLEASVLEDFTVVLKPTLSQRSAWEIEKRESKGKGFKTISTLSGITLHPKLCAFSGRSKVLPAPSEEEMDELLKDMDVMDGVKTKFFLGLLKLCEHTNEKILLVSQYIIPLIFLQRLVAKNKGWNDGKETFMLNGTTSLSDREKLFTQFNNSPDAKIFFASINACNEENTLDGVTRIVMLDIIASPCMAQQAIELAYRPAQGKKVYIYRLVAADNSEEEQDMSAATKEIVAGIWFDEKTYPLDGKLQFPVVEAEFINDKFLGASFMSEDIKTIYKR